MSKWILQSKTFWFAVGFAAISSFDGIIQEWIREHPGLSGSVVSFVFLFLRIITIGPVALRKSDADKI